MQELLTKFNVPGVSIAVIKDFKIEWARGYGIADVETRSAGHARHDVSGGVDQQDGRGDDVAEGGAGQTVHARSGHQHDPEVVEAAGDAEFTRERPVTPRMLMSHTSGMGDGFGFPGYAPNTPCRRCRRCWTDWRRPIAGASGWSVRR